MLSTDGYVSLIKTLLRVAPKNPPAHILAAIQGLAAVLVAARSGLAGRLNANSSTALERAFDILVDRVWVELRDRLTFFEIYLHEGVAKFTDEDRAALEFDSKVDKARLAANLLERLFGDGLEFLRLPFPQQATQMGARLDWMEEQHKLGELDELVGKDLALLVQICQKRYEEMVGNRGSRSGKSLSDLQAIRNDLRRHIYSYCGAIGMMANYGDADPATVDEVELALRPILISRANARRRPGDPGVEAEGEEEGEVEIDASELGVTDGEGSQSLDDADPNASA